MKKVKFFTLVVLFIGGATIDLNAQIYKKSDGGVRIGTPPRTVATWPNLSVVGWQLGAKGLEVSVGDILFHTPGERKMRISSQSISTTSGGLTTFVTATTLTGTLLSFGTGTEYGYSVFANTITSRTPISISSDRRCKENIQTIPDYREKILQLRPVSYDLKVPKNFEGDTMSLKNKVGFIAQEVQGLFPHLVGYVADADQYTLDYTSFIPYLTQIIQTQDRQLQAQEETIESLSNRLTEMEQILSDLVSQPDAVKSPQKAPENGQPEQNTVQQATLFQNTPNPFSRQTMIRYSLPENTPNACIQIHDTHGRRLKNVALPPAQEMGQIEISGGEWRPGTYTYSLIVSGKVADTKRMVITE